MSSALLILLPEESLWSIAQFLIPPDVLHFISVHPTFVPLLCHSKNFWFYMNRVHYGTSYSYNSSNSNTQISSVNNHVQYGTEEDWIKEKNQYLIKSHCSTVSSVRWYSVNTAPTQETRFSRSRTASYVYEEPSAREGHVSCVIGRYLVLTGGFAEDDDVYIKHLDHLDDGTTWKRLRVIEDGTPKNRHLVKKWVYGATLTPLDDTRAIMFGGFQSGGYSNESAQVAILHLVEDNRDDTSSNHAQMSVPKMWWEVMECQLFDSHATTSQSNCYDTNLSFLRIAGRAYHSATLLFDRYLFIVGGMQSRGSILNPILLDCSTGTWYTEGITIGTTSSIRNLDGSGSEIQSPSVPSSRHGCSMIAQLERCRLMLFGGGTGSNLLHSGIDNTEIWALKIVGCNSASDVLSSMPWTWQIIHADQPESHDNGNEDDNQHEVENMEVEDKSNPNRLSSVERCNLGRCHGAYRVSRDIVVFAFGSEETTNSVLCYNLSDDDFFRTRVHPSLTPRGRFTFASAYIESKGIIIFHGGYSTQGNAQALSDTLLLDLAPDMIFRGNHGRLWLPIDSNARNYSNTSESRRRGRGESSNVSFLSFVFLQLTNASVEEQRLISQQILSVVDDIPGVNDTMREILRLFAVGQVQIDEEGTLLCYNVDPEVESELRSLFRP